MRNPAKGKVPLTSLSGHQITGPPKTGLLRPRAAPRVPPGVIFLQEYPVRDEITYVRGTSCLFPEF